MTYNEEQKLLTSIYNHFENCSFWNEEHTEFTIVGTHTDILISISAAGWISVVIEKFNGNDYYAFPSENIEEALQFIFEESER